LVQKQQEAGTKAAGAHQIKAAGASSYFPCYFNENQALDLNGPAQRI
jgi:hypothetical protein